MTSEMEEKIRRIDRVLQVIQNSIDHGVVKQLNKIVEEGITIKSPEQLKTITEVKSGDKVVASTVEDMLSNCKNPYIYKTGNIFVPENIESLPILQAKSKKFVAPETIDLRDYCIKPQDQGDTPYCTAYAAVGFLSNILWRKNDYPETFDPYSVYKLAKEIDNNPDVKGSSLNAALQALINLECFNKDICSVKVLRDIQQVKYAIHKFGCCLLGLNISNEWYDCFNNNKSTISGKSNNTQIGGHAVLACGYNRDGIFIQNSWDSTWGSYGFALISWEELAREFLYGAVIDNCLYDVKMN